MQSTFLGKQVGEKYFKTDSNLDKKEVSMKLSQVDQKIFAYLSWLANDISQIWSILCAFMRLF